MDAFITITTEKSAGTKPALSRPEISGDRKNDEDDFDAVLSPMLHAVQHRYNPQRADGNMADESGSSDACQDDQKAKLSVKQSDEMTINITANVNAVVIPTTAEEKDVFSPGLSQVIPVVSETLPDETSDTGVFDGTKVQDPAVGISGNAGGPEKMVITKSAGVLVTPEESICLADSKPHESALSDPGIQPLITSDEMRAGRKETIKNSYFAMAEDQEAINENLPAGEISKEEVKEFSGLMNSDRGGQDSDKVSGSKDTEASGRNRETTQQVAVKPENMPLLQAEKRTSLDSVLPERPVSGIPETIRIAEHTFTITKKGESSIEVSLDPDGIGKLDIELNLDRGLIHAKISASDSNGKEIIERHAQDILNTLVRDGLNISGFSVSLRDRRDDTDKNFMSDGEEREKEYDAGTLEARRITDSTVSIFV